MDDRKLINFCHNNNNNNNKAEYVMNNGYKDGTFW